MRNENSDNCHSIRSPDGSVEIRFELKTGLVLYVPSENCPFYSIRYGDRAAVAC